MTFIGVVIVLIVFIIAVLILVERYITKGVCIFLTETKDILDNPGKVDSEKYWCEEAEARGFTDVEEFKKIRESEWPEEFLQELMRGHGLTREEAEVVEDLSVYDSFDKEAKRRGITFAEVMARWEEVIKKLPRKFCVVKGGYGVERWARQFEVEKSLPPDIVAHLNQCEDCNANFIVAVIMNSDAENMKESDDEIRQRLGLRSYWEIRAEKLGLTVEELEKRDREQNILRFGGKDCFTLKERIEYARMGRLPMERFAHTTTCLPCLRMVEADRKDYLETGKIGGLAARALEEERKAKNSVLSVA